MRYEGEWLGSDDAGDCVHAVLKKGASLKRNDSALRI